MPCLPGQMKAVKRVPTSGSKCVAAGFGCWVAADDMGPYQSPAGGWTNSPATGVQVCRTTRILELGLFHRSLLPSHSFSHFLNGTATTYITKRPSTQHYLSLPHLTARNNGVPQAQAHHCELSRDMVTSTITGCNNNADNTQMDTLTMVCTRTGSLRPIVYAPSAVLPSTRRTRAD